MVSIADKRVCILHVGGTIGMVQTSEGLVPGPGIVETYLARMGSLWQPQLPRWTLVNLEPLVDSANMRPVDWVRIAGDIVMRHDDFDGFVVLHGTDTMVYSASALSFLLRGLTKPVIFTGAQLSLTDPRSDGRVHLITALTLAAGVDIPESCLYFGGFLFRGNRAQKVNNNDFVAYASGNLPPLAKVGVRVDVSQHLVLSPGDGDLTTALLIREPVISAVRVFPGLTPQMLQAVLAPPIEGVVLETYGAGTFPSADAKLVDVLARAIDRGVVVVNCSQCHSGRVLQKRYGTSRTLADIGVTSGFDMTPEAALTKLYCLFGIGEASESVRERMQEDLAGEITPL